MTISAMTTECPDSIGFTRLHALVARGYQPTFGTPSRDDGHVCIHFTHPRATRKNPPPPVTLWSDGILSTTKVLWPQTYVPEEDKSPPDWQRFILPAEGDRFESFAASVTRPDLVDLYLKPAWTRAKAFAVRLIFGSTLCVLLGLAGKVILSEI